MSLFSVHEKKCISRGEAAAPAVASQSKLSRVSSGFGLSKLTGVRRHRKENNLNKNSPSAQASRKSKSESGLQSLKCHSALFCFDIGVVLF